MKLHLNLSQHILRSSGMKLCYLIFFVSIFCSSTAYAQIKNEADLKKQAANFFEEEDYNSAYKLYAQLVSLYPKDPEYNYKLGVCMLYTEPDKKKPFSYLLLATKNPKDAPKDAKFYLAKTYHVNYKFDEALKLYLEYKEIASQSAIKKLQVDKEIEACKNGKRLLSNLSDLVIVTKKQLNEADYFRSYDVSNIGGKLVIKPDEFKTPFDKKKKDKSVIYIPKNNTRLYFSSYGENGENGRDIYFVNKLPNGAWSKPQSLPSSINTNYDEDYPFLHPNGKTLYFSSKGHNSMGGYDVFKTTLDEQTQTWSKPINVDFPINSPDDDILFVTDSLEKTAYFSTGRYSPYGKIDVLKINTERRPMNFAFLKGTVVKEEITQSLKSKITIKNVENGEIVGTYQAQENGDYSMELPNGGKFIFTVETPGLQTQSESIQMPTAYSLKPYKQVISYDNKILKIINYFDSPVSDDSYATMLDLIEKKAKLEVNENEPYNDALKNQNTVPETNNLNSVSTNNPTVSTKDEVSTANKSLTNEELLNIAKEDAKEAANESITLKQEAQDAYSLATQKQTEATAKQKEADDAMTSANAIADVTLKNEQLTKVNDIQEDAKSLLSIANLATNLAKKLEVDANQKQKEAELTTQYIKQLETIVKNKNNKEALAKLEQIQKELDDLSKQKNQSDELFASLKAEVELKDNELKKAEKANENILTEINALKGETKNLETDLSNETDKSLKDNIAAQIRELNSEVEVKNNDLLLSNKKVEGIKNEAESLNKELAIAAKILNEKSNSEVIEYEDKDIAENNSISTATSAAGSMLSVGALEDKYNTPINNLNGDKTNKENIIKQNELLKSYTNEVKDLIAVDKNQLQKTKDATEKNKLSQEIKQLEKLKADNEKLIAANSLQITKLETVALNNTPVTSEVKVDTDTVSSKLNTAINTNTATSIAVTNDADKVDVVNESKIGNESRATEKLDSEKQKNGEEQILTSTNTKTATQESSPVSTNNTTSLVEGKESTSKVLNAIKQSVDSTTAITEEIFTYNNYKEPSSNALREKANKKIEIVKQNEERLKKSLANASQDVTTKPTSEQVNVLLQEADTLSNKAIDLRLLAGNKVGDEKEKLIQESITNEQLAVTKKLEVADLQKKYNETAFTSNAENLNELQKLTAAKSNNDISLANLLIDEAKLNFNQAQKLRTEANNYPSNSAKLGGLNNAEEKENEALVKQQKALALLIKENPTYKIKETNTTLSNNVVDVINAEINKNAQTQLEAYTELSTVNQNEFTLQSEKLVKNSIFNTSENKIAQDFKKQADGLMADAKMYKQQSVAASKSKEKAELLLKANAKEIEALKALDKASEVLIEPVAKTQIVENNSATNTYSASPSNNENLNNNLATVKNDNALSDNVNSINAPNDLPTNDSSNEKLTNNVNNIPNTAVESNTTSPANSVVVPESAITANDTKINTTDNSSPVTNTTISTTSISTTNNTTTSSTNKEKETSQLNTDDNSNNAVNNAISENNESENATSITTNKNTIAGENEVKVVNNSDDTKNSNRKKSNASNETNVTPLGTKFNNYTNPEAVSLKNVALEKINAAENQEKIIKAKLNEATSNSLPVNGGEPVTVNQNDISALVTEADKLNDQAFELRRASVSKSVKEKEVDIEEAKRLENLAISKKVDASKQQQQLNLNTFKTNQQSLEELASMAKDKNIEELSTANMQFEEANLFFKQSEKLRDEANSYPTDAAKLGGYGNAEEKEALALLKQKTLLETYKKYFADYVPKTSVYNSSNLAQPNLDENQKAALNANTEKYIEGLNLLSQANDKEYKSSLSSLPTNLNTTQTKLKTEAVLAYNKQQELLGEANQTKEVDDKKNKILAANQSGQTAINLLKQIKTTTSSSENIEVNKNNKIPNNESNVSAVSLSNVNSAQPKVTTTLKIEGLEIKNVNAYSEANPIPIDKNLPNGLIFKVQIGAFKTPLPNNTFKGLSPIIAQTIPSGYIRYMAGDFELYKDANAVKNDLKNIGYTDAFVVAYYDGKRINLNEATAKAQTKGQEITPVENTSAGITVNSNVPINTGATTLSQNAINSNNTTTIDNNQTVIVTKQLEEINGLLYTVQIGIFSQQVKRSQLLNLGPIYTEKLPNGLYRYTAGIYNQPNKLITDKRKVVDLGLKDAFVTAYYNSKRISFTEGKKLQLEDKNLKMEPENAIVFPESNTTSISKTNDSPVNSVKLPQENKIEPLKPVTEVTPNITKSNAFSNGVTSGPVPTAENGVKTDEAGISFKVQIGAYKNQVPNEVSSKFLSIKTWPVNNTAINGLYIYTIGNFTGLSFAKQLKNEVVALGITDAFVTVYKDGKKLYGAEAAQYLNK